MLKRLRYDLQPPELEQQFSESTLAADKRRLAWFYAIGLSIMATFAVLSVLLSYSMASVVVSRVRLIGIAVILLSAVSLRRISSRRMLDWSTFACLMWIVIQVEIRGYFQIAPLEALIAWDVLIILVVYLVVPLGLSFQASLSATLTIGSMGIWFTVNAVQLHGFEYIGVVSAYVAANVFGFVGAIHAKRVAREGYALLADEKRLQEELKVAHEQLQESVESKNKIYLMLAHDLRGSIGAMGSIGEHLTAGYETNDAERSSMIELLRDASKSSYDLLENLLQWTLSEHGDADPKLQEIRVLEAIDECVQFLTILSHRKGVDLSVRFGREVETVWADPRMLDAVVRNLASNAIKFTQPGGSVRIEVERASDAFARISVSDTGMGIEKERLSQIFNLSYGEGSRGTDGERGTNLGLRICSEFVAKQGGEISVSSELGKGSCFRFTIPLSRDALAAGN